VKNGCINVFRSEDADEVSTVENETAIWPEKAGI
jgi:hypothetical protein